MGQSRDAQRLERLAGTRVHAAVLVDRPKGFARAKDRFLSTAVDDGRSRSSELVDLLAGRLREDDRDRAIETALGNAVFLGVSSSDLLVADRARITGQPRRVIRRDAIADVRVRWLDNEQAGLRSRVVVVEFPDGTWTMLATPWKRLIPDDAAHLIQAFGTNARRMPRPEAGRTIR